MLKIELSDLRFHGFHGVHEEEKKTGGDFEVNLAVYFQPASLPILHLNETIDYTKLYEIVRQRMYHPTYLIETLATEIAQEILSRFLQSEKITVSIKKLHPPIPFFNGSVSAEYTTTRK